MPRVFLRMAFCWLVTTCQEVCKSPSDQLMWEWNDNETLRQFCVNLRKMLASDNPVSTCSKFVRTSFINLSLFRILFLKSNCYGTGPGLGWGKEERVNAVGWGTLSCLVSVTIHFIISWKLEKWNLKQETRSTLLNACEIRITFARWRVILWKKNVLRRAEETRNCQPIV